jgi:hypothetical protein
MSTAAQRLRALATERFPTLTPAEERLMDCAADGKEADYKSPNDDENDLRQADTWGPERTIHAEVLRWLCVDRDAIRHIDPKGLSIHGARIDGELDLRMVTISFPLFLVRCAIRAPVNLAFAEVRLVGIEGSIGESIHGDGMVVHGDLWLRDGFLAKGGVRLVNVTIAGTLDCTGGRFLNEGGIALGASGAKIDGSMLLRQGFHAEGQVDLFGATIAGNLDCSGGTFHNEGGTALAGGGAKIDGSVFLSEGFQAQGEIDLAGATIAGHVGCDGGTFRNEGRTALGASGAKIGGSIFLRQGFHAEGFVHLDGTQIQGYLDCNSASFSGAAPNGLSGEAMTVGRLLDWRQVTTNKATILNLPGAQVGELADDKDSWPGSKDPDIRHLDLDGFVYGAIFDGPTDATTRLQWLAQQTPIPLGYAHMAKQPSPRPFRPQPYQQLAKVLRERGQDAEAREILIAKEETRLSQDSTLSRKEYYWHWCLGWSLAHGYKPQRMLFAAGVVVILGCGIFALGDWAGMMVPSKAEVYTHYERSGQVPPFYPRFNPVLYSLDTLLPIINFGHKEHWGPRYGTPASSIPSQWAQLGVKSAIASSLSPTAVQGEGLGGRAATILRSLWATICTWVTDGRALHLYRLGHIAAGWLLITLGIAGVTGLVRKE